MKLNIYLYGYSGYWPVNSTVNLQLMYHYLRVLPSISVFWTHQRQTLLLFAITFIKIGKQAKEKKLFILSGQVCLCLAKLGLHFPYGMKTEPYRSALTRVPESATPCPGEERFLFHVALLGNSKETQSRQPRRPCFTLDVKKVFYPLLSCLGARMGKLFSKIFFHSLGIDDLVSNPATKHKRGRDARKVAPKIWGQVVRSRALGWREITPVLFWRVLS